MAFKVFDLLAKKNINVDIILQSIGRDGTKDISFTVSRDQMDEAVKALEENHARIKAQKNRSRSDRCEIVYCRSRNADTSGRSSRYV